MSKFYFPRPLPMALCACLAICSFFATAQCPKLNNNATLTGDCAPGITPCTVCPGDQIILNATGTGLQPGVCVNWYYGTTNTFNPYNNEGTLMGCAQVAPTTPMPCNGCPLTIAIFVDACGTEANNEIMAITSGSGFYVDDLQITFDPANSLGSGDAGIGSGCGWQEPAANAVSSIQTICPNATIVGAGPGEAVPPGVPVIIFTSAGFDFNYNFGSLCPVSPVIYVMQNSCERTSDAFTNGPGGGSVSTTVSLACGCSDNTTYNVGSLVGGNGAFVTDAGFPAFYGNAGCGFPPFPGGGGGGGNTAIVIPPFTYTITPDMCNGGPYYAVGIVEPLPPGCMPSMATTNYIPFNVPCPMPVLQAGPDICEMAAPYDLNQLADPAVPVGVWSGPGVTGNDFDPGGLAGSQTITFTPTAACGVAATTTINVVQSPTANFNAVPAGCPGQNVNLVLNLFGQAPFDFDLFAGSTFVGSYTSVNSVFNFPTVNPLLTTTYSIQNFKDVFCDGMDASVTVNVTAGPSAVLALTGPNSICAGQNTSFSVDFTGGTPPFTFVPRINGVNQPAITTSNDPHTFSMTLPTPGNITVTLGSVSAGSCQGTVSGTALITVNNAPTATIIKSVKTICSGQPDTVFVATSAAGLNLTYTQNGTPQAPIITTTPVTAILVTPNPGLNAYALLNLTGAACPGIVSGSDTTIVETAPTATFSGDTALCNGATAQLRVNFTGTGPVTLSYSANGVVQPPIIAPFSPHSFFINPAVSTTYILTSVALGSCSTPLNDTVHVAVGLNPTATLSGDHDLCVNGTGDSLTVVFGGIGPTYTFIYSANGVAQPPITTTQNPYKIFVNPSGYVEYTLVSVTNGSCTGTVSGTADVFVYTPSSAMIGGNLTFCDSVSTTLVVTMTGTAPFIITYAINGIAQPADTTDESPYLIPAHVTQTTTYSLVSIQSPGCTGIVNGTATITINRAPSYTNLQSICNPAAGTYIVQFEALNAALPLTVVSGGGSFSGNLYSSPPIPLASGYNIVFRDANNCGDITISGPSTCNCASKAGTMNLTPLTPCAGEPVTAIHNGDQVNDGNDVLRYILHTNPALPIGQILAWNLTPDFAFTGTLQAGITYYISAIIGNSDGAGQVDLNDPCRSVSQGTPVTWIENPTASLSGNYDICPGESQVLNIALTGAAPFDITYTSNGQSVTATSATTNYAINTNLQQTTTFQLVSVSDKNCTGTAAGNAVVTVHTVPQITNFQTDCTPNNQNYSLSFQVTDADFATLLFSGNTGTFNASTQVFTSNLIPATDPYLIQISDVWACGVDSVSGVSNCNCLTDAGTMSTTAINLCNGQTATITAATGAQLDTDDGLIYLLTTTNDPFTWTVLAINTVPSFIFLSGSMTTNTTYYVVAAAGNQTPTGINFNDGCLDYSNATPVLWRAPVTATIAGNAVICPGASATLNVQLSGGSGTYTFNYLANGLPQPAQSTANSNFPIVVNPSVSTNYILTTVAAAGCTGTVSGSANITVQAIPQAINAAAICDPNGLTYTLQFDISNGAAPNGLYTVTGVPGALTDTIFTSSPITLNTPYNITVSTSAGCTTTLSGAGICECITDAGSLTTATPDLCINELLVFTQDTAATLDGNDQLIYVLCQNPAQLPTGILASSPTPQFAYQTGWSTTTPLYIVAVAGNALPNGNPVWTDACLDISAPLAVMFHAPPDAVILSDTTVCGGSTVNLKVNLQGSGPFSIVYTVNGILQPTVTTPLSTYQIAVTNVQETQIIRLVSVANDYCTTPLSSAVTITVLPRPKLVISGAGSVCPGDTATLVLTLQGSTAASVEMLQNGGNPLFFNIINGAITIKVAPLVTTTYTIASAIFSNNTCPPDLTGTATVIVAPIAISVTTSNYNGFDVSCVGSADGSIAVTATGGGGQYTYTWNGGGSGAELSGLTEGTFLLTVTDQHGCTHTDQVILLEPTYIDFDFVVKNPRCYGEINGTITLTQVSGGAGGYTIQVDNSLAIPITNVPFAAGGYTSNDYIIVVSDANGCTADDLATITEPIQLVIDLGSDRSIQFGDSTLINTVLNFTTIDTFFWTPANWLSTPTELITWAQPFQSQLYTLQVTDTSGCIVSEDIAITVLRDNRIFIPNVFDPGSDGDNALFTVFGGPEVRSVRYLRIYDRWGELVFDQQNFAPNDLSKGWNGYWRDKRAGQGVYAYITEIEFIDGKTLLISGDVTVAR